MNQLHALVHIIIKRHVERKEKGPRNPHFPIVNQAQLTSLNSQAIQSGPFTRRQMQRPPAKTDRHRASMEHRTSTPGSSRSRGGRRHPKPTPAAGSLQGAPSSFPAPSRASSSASPAASSASRSLATTRQSSPAKQRKHTIESCLFTLYDN